MNVKTFLFATLAVIATAQAAAQPYTPVCNVVNPKAVVLIKDIQDSKAYACAPRPIGDGTFPSISTNDKGTTLWWYCQDLKTKVWSAQIAAATTEYFTTFYTDPKPSAIFVSADPLNVLNSIIVKNATLPLTDPSLTPVWCPVLDKIYNGTPSNVISLVK